MCDSNDRFDVKNLQLFKLSWLSLSAGLSIRYIRSLILFTKIISDIWLL